MAISMRFRILVTLVALVGLLAAADPQASDAASRRISASTYESTMNCVGGAEPSCQTNSGDRPYTLLQVSGEGFSAYGIAYVTVIDVVTWSYVITAYVPVDGSGRFLFKETGVEVCSTGMPLLVQAYDFVGQANSNVVTVIECA